MIGFVKRFACLLFGHEWYFQQENIDRLCITVTTKECENCGEFSVDSVMEQ